MRPPRQALLIKPSHMGDVVRTLPVLCAMGDAWPQARIDWLIHPVNAPVIDGHPLIRRLVPFDRDRFGHWVTRANVRREFLAFLRSLRQADYDLVVDLQGLFRTGFLSLVTGAPRRLGLDCCRELAGGFYTRRVSTRGARHAVEVNLRVAAAMGLPIDRPRFDVPVSPAAWAAARGKCDLLEGAFAALCPGATADSKRFRPEGFAAIADRLHRERRLPAVLLGSPSEADDCRRVAEACREARPVPLAGRTNVAELVAILAHARLCVANDSGPLHLAAALGTPILGLYGPTDPAAVGPYGQLGRVVLSPVPLTRGSYRRAGRSSIDAIELPAVLAKLEEVLADGV